MDNPERHDDRVGLRHSRRPGQRPGGDSPGAMRKLADAPGPYFLEVVVRPEENVFPMVPAGESLSNVMCKE